MTANAQLGSTRTCFAGVPFVAASLFALFAVAPSTLAQSPAAQPRDSAVPQSAPQHSQPAQPQSKWRVLTRAEGRAIVNVAWEHEQPVSTSQDCSHLVQQIYAQAGYEYPYASSFDLYAGNPHFARVKHPQPGDVIAWPGHVGIVVNAAQHSFFSMVRSGAEAEDYTSAYWRSRGRPRFYRYLVENSSRPHSQKTLASTRVSHAPEEVSSKVAIERDSDTSSSPNAKFPVQEASERAVVPPAADPPASRTAAPPSAVPANISINAAQRNPTKEELTNSISEWSKNSGEVLRTGEPLKFFLPIVIFDQLAVDRVRIKGDSGSVDLRIDSAVLLNADGADFKQRHETLRWELRRTDLGWVAVASRERTYVPREVAVRVFAAQLAQLAESDAAAAHDETVLGQEARLANLLSALLQNK